MSMATPSCWLLDWQRHDDFDDHNDDNNWNDWGSNSDGDDNTELNTVQIDNSKISHIIIVLGDRAQAKKMGAYLK